MLTFKELGLEDRLLTAITDMGFTKPSEIQEKAIPILLEKDKDLVALAQTGTGKTAAFGFPLLQKIDPAKKSVQGLILSPTRELCLQITQELALYGAHMPGINTVAVYGGASITDQASKLRKGAQIVVATPGRIKDMISRRLIDISSIRYCILDEADEMLNMGFLDDIKDILSNTPSERHTWLFSATMPKEVAQIAKQFMRKPDEITVGSKNTGSVNVNHEYYVVSGNNRYKALKRLADANPEIFSVIFCRTKRDTQRIAEKLIEDGYNAGALHGDLSQNQRDIVMKSFRNRQIQMLVATDVAARGIDVDDITHVINYQLPDETETYTHRSGRTGRAGKSGISMVIITKSEIRKIRSIERIIKKEFERKDIPGPEEICEIQLYHLSDKIRNTKIDKNIEPYLPAVNDVLEGIDREELIRKLVTVEFSRFASYYKDTDNLNASGDERVSGGNESVRYFINVGARDGYDWKTLKDFLRVQLNLERDEVFKVEVKDSFSFFSSEPSVKQQILDTFSEFKLDGRFINVEISEPTGRGGGGKKGKKGRKSRERFDGNQKFGHKGKRGKQSAKNKNKRKQR
ncbi:DEAD/DEAH box helicase [Robertkochia aurantiaca]|uniref:DEAD/DEAH box helicase n=1 Tax=Robertkochia aurantiaca TaxID=2873700 RepID=UPI001CCEA307|nr:DEAD/DEAH box helicase [Robertkochia sp. 3YJGBD-33]